MVKRRRSSAPVEAPNTASGDERPAEALPEGIVVGNSASDPFEPRVESLVRAKTPGEALRKAEVIIRKRHIDRDGREQGAMKRVFENKKRRAERFNILRPITPASVILKQSRRNWKDQSRLKRCDRLISYGRGQVKHADTHRALFVMRNTKRGLSKLSRQLVKDIGISQIYTGVFLPNTPSTMELLYRVAPFVVFGYPTLATVQRMFQKVARLKTRQSTFTTASLDGDEESDDEAEEQALAKKAKHHSKAPMAPTAALLQLQLTAQLNELDLSDNTVIEARMGKLGVLCVDDVIHEIWTNGNHFSDISEQLAPFRLANLMKSDGVERRPLEAGNLGAFINSRLSQIV